MLAGKKEKKSFTAWIFFVGAVLAGGSAYLIYSIPLFTPRADEMIPSNDLLLFADIGSPTCPQKIADNTNSICSQRSEFLELFFEAYPERLATFVDSLAIATYKEPLNTENETSTILFLRIQDPKAAENFVLNYNSNNAPEQGIQKDVRYFSFSEGRKKTFIIWRGWLVIAPNTTFIDQLVAVKKQESPSLSSDNKYANLKTMDSSSLSRVFIRKEAAVLLEEQTQGFATFFGDFFPEILITLSASKDGLSVDIHARPTADIIPSETSENDFLKVFSTLPTEDTKLLVGFSRAAKEFTRIIKMIEEVDLSYSLFLQGKIQGFLTEYFDTKISLEYDIMPLLQNESVFALVQQEEVLVPVILAVVDDEEFAAAKQQKMRNALSNVATTFVPRILTHELEDGTQITEITGCNDCVTITTEATTNGEITFFSAENETGEKKTISLGRTGDIFAVSLQNNILAEIMQKSSSGNVSLPKITASIPKISQQKEIITFSPSVLNSFGIMPGNWISDFSLVTMLHSESENGWTLSTEGKFHGK